MSYDQGFIIHYVGYIWDSVSVHYREGVLWRGVSAKRGSTILMMYMLIQSSDSLSEAGDFLCLETDKTNDN